MPLNGLKTLFNIRSMMVPMKALIQVVAFSLALWCCLFPVNLRADGGEGGQIILRDVEAGYVLPLPVGWREVTDSSALDSLVRRVCSMFMTGDDKANLTYVRGAILPVDQKASPALVVFALDYASLGLNEAALKDITTESQTLTAGLANATQTLYMQHFPHSVKLYDRLGDDFFSLHLRTILDLADEQATTRNRYIKMLLTSERVIVLMTLYDGPSVANYEVALAKCVRELLPLAEKSLDKVNPPYQASGFDYLLVVLAIIVAVYVLRKVRAFMRS